MIVPKSEIYGLFRSVHLDNSMVLWYNQNGNKCSFRRRKNHMKFPKILKVFSIVLTFALLLQVMPMSAFSSLAEEFENQSLIDEHNERSEFKSSAEVLEVNELRQSDEKTFRLTDGTFYIAHYDTDIHELDENGEWANIDNRLYDK